MRLPLRALPRALQLPLRRHWLGAQARSWTLMLHSPQLPTLLLPAIPLQPAAAMALVLRKSRGSSSRRLLR